MTLAKSAYKLCDLLKGKRLTDRPIGVPAMWKRTKLDYRPARVCMVYQRVYLVAILGSWRSVRE